jgi:hypothetical protein
MPALGIRSPSSCESSSSVVTLISFFEILPCVNAYRAEELGGPTATCEVTTFDAEAQLELPFDADKAYVRVSQYACTCLYASVVSSKLY